MVANSVTEGLFQANLFDFLTGRNQAGAYLPGTDGSKRLTLPELFGMGPGGVGGNFTGTDTLSSVLKSNFETNVGKMAVSVIGIPIIAKVATKVLRKPVLTPMNKALSMTGLDVKV